MKAVCVQFIAKFEVVVVVDHDGGDNHDRDDNDDISELTRGRVTPVKMSSARCYLTAYWLTKVTLTQQ